MFRVFHASFSTLLIACHIVAAPSSEEPLSGTMFMTRAEMVVDSVKFNNWLIENHVGLEGNQLQGVKEHAYLLIDTVVKDRHSEGRGEFSEHELFVLRTILNWGTQLGLYGCGLVAEYINASMPAPPSPPNEPIPLPAGPWPTTVVITPEG